MYLFPVARTAQQVVGLAKRTGVRRIVALSSGAVTGGFDTDFHLPVERAVEDSRLEWTHVRPGEFMLNKLWLWGPSIRAESVVYDPFPDVAWCPVHERDIAVVVVAVLLEDGHRGRAYDLNGRHLSCATHHAGDVDLRARDPGSLGAPSPSPSAPVRPPRTASAQPTRTAGHSARSARWNRFPEPCRSGWPSAVTANFCRPRWTVRPPSRRGRRCSPTPARPTWPTTFRPRCAGRWASRAAPRSVADRHVHDGHRPVGESCSGVTDAAGVATCTIANVVQPPSAASVPIQLAFAGDDFYWSWTASASAKLLFYTGRATGLSAKLLILPPAVVSDTGEVSTASRSTTRRAAVSWANGLLTATGISASVTTGGGTSSAKASTGQLTLRLAGLPVIRATDLQTTSQSSCQIGPFTADASGSVTIGSLSIGGVAQSVVTVGPNTVIRAAVLTITLNEQKPVNGSSAGLAVNAMRVSAPGLADVVVPLAKTDIHNCP